MMKYKKYLIWVLIAVVVIIILKRIADRKPEMTMPNGGTVGGGVVPARFKPDVSKANPETVISSGVKNSNEVAYFQTWLNQYYNAGLVVDGDFGARTAAALKLAKDKTFPISFSLHAMGIL